MSAVNQLKNKARREEQRENWSRAIEFYTQALDASRRDGEAFADVSLYNRIGDIYLRIGQKNTAVRYYEQAIERYSEQDLHTSAIALCNKVLRILPERSTIYLQLGRLHLATNLIADARRHYHRYADAMRDRSGMAAAYEGLEELIERTGDAATLSKWMSWLAEESDPGSAAERVDGVRETLADQGIDADELLERVEAGDIEDFKMGTSAATREDPLAGAFLAMIDEPSVDAEAAPPDLPGLDEPAEEAPAPIEDDAEAIDDEVAATAEGDRPFDGDEAEGASLAFDPTPAWRPEGQESGLDFAPGGEDRWGAERASEPAPDGSSPLPEPTRAPLDEVEDEFGVPAEIAARGSEEGRPAARLERSESDALAGPQPIGEARSASLEREERSEDRPDPEVGASRRPPDLERAEASASPTVDRLESPRIASLDLEDPIIVEPRGDERGPEHEASEAEPPEPWAGSEPRDLTDEPETGLGSIGRPGWQPAQEDEEPWLTAEDIEGALDRGQDQDPDGGAREAGEPSSEAREAPPHGELSPEFGEAGEDVDGAPPSPAGSGLPAEREPGEADPVSPTTGASVGFERAGVEPSLEAGPIELPEVPEPPAADAPPDPEAPRVSEAERAADAEDPADGREAGPAEPRRTAHVEAESTEDVERTTLSSVEPDPSEPEAATADAKATFAEPDPSPGEAEIGAEALESMAGESVLEPADHEVLGEPPSPARRSTPLERSDDAATPGVPPADAGRGASSVDPEDAFVEWVESASPRVLQRALPELEQRNEREKALLVIRRLGQFEESGLTYRRRYVDALQELGRPEEAVEACLELAVALEEASHPIEARDAYRRVLGLVPGEARARAGLDRLEQLDEDVGEEPDRSGTTPYSPNQATRSEFDMIATPPRPGTDRPNGSPMPTGPTVGGPGAHPRPYSGVAGGSEAASDFEQLLSEFRAELHEKPAHSDSMSRTELGASLKEMGRLDDAIRELQAAVREPSPPPLAYELLGETFVEKGQERIAVRLLEKALATSTHSDRELLGVLYQLGVTYEKLMEPAKALLCYERIFSVDIDYRDVQKRILACSG